MPRKRKKQPIWKRWGPEASSFFAHVGKAIDNGNILKYAIYGGLAFLGYHEFKHWKGLLWGPVSLQLATSNNLAAGAAGVAGLAILGMGAAFPTMKHFSEAVIGKNVSVKKDPETGEYEATVSSADGGLMKFKVYSEKVGPPGFEGPTRVWIPGLGWVYPSE